MKDTPTPLRKRPTIMYKPKTTALAFVLGITALLQTGCFGTFALTRKAYEFHDGITQNKFIKSLLFWIPGSLVYGVTTFVDAVILNLIEFWTGTNPLSMNEGDHEMQLATVNGEQFRVEATKDTFTTTQLTGSQAGEVRTMKFDRATRTWNYTDSRVCDQPVLTFLDDSADNVRLYGEEGSVDLALSDVDGSAPMARLTNSALHCAN